MKEIILTQGQVALIDDEDFERVNQFKWCCLKKYNNFYSITNIKISKYKWTNLYLHTFIFGKKDGFMIDHIDGNGLNNQKSNLRYATKSQNNMNQKICRGTTSKYKGVCIAKNCIKYSASIIIDKKKKHLGSFETEIEAAKAYDEAAIKYFGEFARLNFK